MITQCVVGVSAWQANRMAAGRRMSRSNRSCWLGRLAHQAALISGRRIDHHDGVLASSWTGSGGFASVQATIIITHTFSLKDDLVCALVPINAPVRQRRCFLFSSAFSAYADT